MKTKMRGINLSKHGFAFYFTHSLIWLRYGQRIIVLKRGPLLFSERNRYQKYHNLVFGWRLIFLL